MPLPPADQPFLRAAAVMARAAADAINTAANHVGAEAIDEAPLEVGTLRASARGPWNDEDGSHTATSDNLEAQVSFNTVYAAAQHEGIMEYQRDGKTILWVVKHYTTPDTKSHYLEDPLKANAARYETVIGLSVEKALAEHYRQSA